MSNSVDFQEFETLYQEHHIWLQQWFCKRLGCGYQASDLAQDTFVKILLKHIDRHNFQTPRFYLLHIAKGLLIDYWRRNTLEQTYLEALALEPEVSSDSPELQAMMIETLIEIDAMLDKLPQKVRQAFIYAQLEGWTYKEIASVLGVSERMVKKYMMVAIRHCLDYKKQLQSALAK